MTELETIVELYNDDNRRSEVMERAGEILKKGGLVAFPTETVYGLGGDALNPEASARIYAAKGRPSDNPLIVHIADMEALKVLASEVPEKARLLADRFWPGPLTMIMPKSDAVPYATTGGLDTVAIRMPSHPTAYELIRSSGVYIAAPSANTSGRPSPTTAQHVYEDLNGRIEPDGRCSGSKMWQSGYRIGIYHCGSDRRDTNDSAPGLYNEGNAGRGCGPCDH